MRIPPVLAASAALLLLLVAVRPARAEPEALPLRGRASAAGGAVLSRDQLRSFELDLPVLEGSARLGWFVHEAVLLELAVAGGAFLSSTQDPGGLFDAALGAELAPAGLAIRPWVAAHFGVGVTGLLARPVLRLSAGVDIAASREVALGPSLAYGHVFQHDRPDASDDAQFLTIGLSVTLRPPPGAPERAAAPRPLRRPPPIAAAPPREPGPPPPPPVPQEELHSLLDEAIGIAPRELLVPVLFEHDSAELLGCSVAALHTLREHLAEHGEIRVLEIEGHADGSGSGAYNAALSQRRADAIRGWLIAHGIEPERLRTAARGESAPIEGNDAEAGREQNRRVRFRVLAEDR